MTKPFCDFVSVNGTWLPNVASVSERSIDIGDEERSINGTLRIAHDGTAREWTVQLAGVPGTDVPALRALLSSPMPSLVNVMGDEVIASVRMPAVAFTPKLRGTVRSPADFGRANVEVTIREVSVDQVLPGFTYAYQAFLDPGPFEWDWDEAGQPAMGDILRLGGGGGGGLGRGKNSLPILDGDWRWAGGGGGGAGGLLVTLGHTLAGNLTGIVGLGGAPGMQGQDTTVAGLPDAVGGGAGGRDAQSGFAGGSGGGGGDGNMAGGSPAEGQGHAGGSGQLTVSSGGRSVFRDAGGGGGAGGQGSTNAQGGIGVDLLALGWNYRLIPGVPRFLAGGGGGATRGPGGNAGGAGGGGNGGLSSSTPAQAGTPGTGGGGGGGRSATAAADAPTPPDTPGAPGGSGLTIVRWRV